MKEDLSFVHDEIILYARFLYASFFSPSKEICKMSENFLKYSEIFDN